MSEVRLRVLLRQADGVAEAGKRAAAAQLYQEILDEAPQAVAAWLGLAQVAATDEAKRAAYEQVLRLEPDNKEAVTGLDWLANGRPPEVVEETAVSSEPVAAVEEPGETAVFPPDEPTTVAEENYDLVCYRHADRQTSLRCYSCGRPICIECTHKTPVGYICPVCQREAEDVFFNAKSSDYLVAPAVALPLSLLAGFLVVQLGGRGGFLLFFIIFAVSGAIGSFIGRLAKRAIGQRRGRYLPHAVAGMVVLGALPFLLLPLLGLLFGGVSNLLGLIMPGIYLFVATGAAFYQMK
jgi:hypothetical protein